MINIFHLSELNKYSETITPTTILKECNKLTLQDGLVGFDSSVVGEVRKSKIAFINDKHHVLNNLMFDIATEINDAHFGFDIHKVESLQYSIYDEKDLGHYDWHIDTQFINNNFTQRKISIVVQLSDPTKYKGGNLKLDVADYGVEWNDTFQEYANKKGAVIVFPSFVKHTVTPVTKGTRKSLIAWVSGANFR